MASLIPFPSPAVVSPPAPSPIRRKMRLSPPTLSSSQSPRKRTSTAVVAAYGDVSADSTTYLLAGALAVALLGTAFPLLFSRQDLCPECDGAGFVRRSGVRLRANAARKDQNQIVCPRCKGLGKLDQIDK